MKPFLVKVNVWWILGMLSLRKYLFAVGFHHGRSPPFARLTRCQRGTQQSQSLNTLHQNKIDTDARKNLLHESLVALDIDAEQLSEAALQSIVDPTQGYDGRWGKSAIKTYRSFIFPKQKQFTTMLDFDTVQLQAAARRTSLQIQFLLARHKSHQADWIRHHDNEDSFQSQGSNKQIDYFPLILLLDNLRSAQNVGSLFRTADAAGVRQIITCGITPHPNGSGSDKLRKTALGADVVIPSCHFGTTRQGIEHVRQQSPDYAVIGMETTAQSEVYTSHDFKHHAGVCIVLGNEVTGVDSELLPLFDAILEIPMFGVKNSLNVAACAPIMIYEIIRQWQTK
jgi:23S rRNA (guanosine2251-2'-O)-methyltransferase